MYNCLIFRSVQRNLQHVNTNGFSKQKAGLPFVPGGFPALIYRKREFDSNITCNQTWGDYSINVIDDDYE